MGTVLWTDGSMLDTVNIGAAVTWRDKSPNKWRETSLFLGKSKRYLMVNYGQLPLHSKLQIEKQEGILVRL